MKTIKIELRPDDAEPLLREAAEHSAKYGSWVDHFTRRTYNTPGYWPDMRAEWQLKFLRAKRVVEAFGVEIERTSEEETLTVNYAYVGGKVEVVTAGGIAFNLNRGSKPDYKHPRPSYRGAVHAEACRQAANRVVRRWRACLETRNEPHP